MTLKELKETIANSPNKEWYQRKSIRINYKHIGYDQTITGVPSIYEFVLNQIDGFGKTENLPEEMLQVSRSFKTARDRIVEHLKADNARDHNWNQAFAPIIQLNTGGFLYGAPETNFLLKLFAINPEYYAGAYRFITGAIEQTGLKDRQIGYYLAAEFITRDLSVADIKRKAEKEEALSVRKDMQKTLDECQSTSVNFIKFINDEALNITNAFNKFRGDKEKSFNVLFSTATNDLNSFNKESMGKLEKLEQLYREKLKLEAPAAYWRTRARSLRIEGRWWLAGLILCLVITIVSLIIVLFALSNGSLSEIFNNSGTAIKWSVLFITFVSFLAYAVRIFSKLTFSSFHLVRDAEEREQLTYVYLALQKDKEIDPTERHLIMQSLFSRADSGLLKDDASPTMPGNILDKFSQK